MTADKPPVAVTPNPLLKRAWIYVFVLISVFLIGFIPMWLTARGCENELAETRRELKLSQIQNNLAGAAVDARRGDYEPARQAASDFFTTLRAEMDRGNDSALTQAQRDRMTPLFAGRDEMITLLARSDPAGADRLSELYLSYRKAIKGA